MMVVVEDSKRRHCWRLSLSSLLSPLPKQELMASVSSLLLLLLAATVATGTATGGHPHPRHREITHLKFYTSNVTTYMVAGLGNKPPSYFGDVVVYDTPLTLSPDPRSKSIGQGQGMAVGTSQTDASLLTMINFVFTDGEYKGSSLAMYGGTNGMGYGDRPIVGGSGKFRMAHGYAISKILQMTPYVVVVFDVYVVV